MSGERTAGQADPDCTRCRGSGLRTFVTSEDPDMMARFRRHVGNPTLESWEVRCDCMDRGTPTGEVACSCPEGYEDANECLAARLGVPLAELDGDPEHHGCACDCHQ